MMKFTVPIFILTLLLISACNVDNRTDEEIRSLIKEHENELFFLSFWPGINDQDFKRIIKYENSLGNLESGRFVFNIQSADNLTKVPFQIRNTRHGVDLIYSDSYEIVSDGSRIGPERDGSGVGKFYYRIRDNLEKTLNENYEFLGSEDNSMYWKSINEPCKVVELYSFIDYLHLTDNYFSQPAKGSKVRLASCTMVLDYMTCEHYNSQIEYELNKTLEEEKQKQQKLIEAERNNEKL
ncbi:hypothetical protein [Reichenbachiella sp. MALMAid0571]|uniref:hypothetical protein n=1 Tax=Reichenbachiella sp. MALMAid0571 TaxID=3143939 RepID=UPI0032DEC35E